MSGAVACTSRPSLAHHAIPSHINPPLPGLTTTKCRLVGSLPSTRHPAHQPDSQSVLINQFLVTLLQLLVWNDPSMYAPSCCTACALVLHIDGAPVCTSSSPLAVVHHSWVLAARQQFFLELTWLDSIVPATLVAAHLSLNFEQRQEVLDVDMDAFPYFPSGFDDDENWDDIADGFLPLPPGEEAILQSHAGGEAIFQEMIAGMKPGRGDPRLRTARIQEVNKKWAAQIPQLVDAYLKFKYEGPAILDETAAWPLAVLSFSEHGFKYFSHPPDVQRANAAHLGASPEQPVLAFPLHLFEVYRQEHRVCPRFSIDAIAKTLNHLHKMPRKECLSEQITIAYDAYLAIMHGVDNRVAVALRRTDNWYLKNVCAPCFYTTIHEPPLKPKYLGAMDGNNSLKHVDTALLSGKPRTDHRTSTSPRWISPEEVDQLKDEVANAQAKRKKKKVPAAAAPVPTPTDTPADPSAAADSDSDGDDNVAWLNVNELEATEVTELEKCINACVERWRAAAPEARKKMLKLFAVAGIFLSVCRHGHVLAMCDMIRSGELMKYPLAIVRRLLDEFGSDIGLGYDIICTFFKTLLRSSLGARVVALRLQGVVLTFHGHAHNRECQLSWHPLYTQGVGLEDFEECERTFARSNNLASVTRLASAFHRKQQIDEHFDFHDQDKHANSGKSIFANYRQALEKIDTNTQQLKELERRLGTTAADYEQFFQDERTYFESKKAEPPEVAQTVEYMDPLQKLEAAALESRRAQQEYQRMDYYIVNNPWQRPEITACTHRYRSSHSRHLGVEQEVSLFEEEHGIVDRWPPESKEYTDALLLISKHKYRRCLDKLESLVVKRLFELTKLGMSGLAYKMREKISKALRTHAEAIRTALEKYNSAAAQLNPLRDRLTWAAVIDTVALADFDLLRDTTTDIRKLPWANPANREAMVLYFGTLHDHVNYLRAIHTHIVTPHLTHELHQQWLHRSRIHVSIANQLAKTSRLSGFSGTLFPGTREGRDPLLNEAESLPAWAAEELGIMREIVEYEEPQILMAPPQMDVDDSDKEYEGVKNEGWPLKQKGDARTPSPPTALLPFPTSDTTYFCLGRPYQSLPPLPTALLPTEEPEDDMPPSASSQEYGPDPILDEATIMTLDANERIWDLEKEYMRPGYSIDIDSGAYNPASIGSHLDTPRTVQDMAHA
ncbi:hypothetical protein B0H14DRAFT_3863115 [Mycena olivaceomarginata]|nr:hypothetical protein B0H14DRAFT_3863115 [Mycena olivaceomarginata]